MQLEINRASAFISELYRKSFPSEADEATFRKELNRLLQTRIEGHWFPEQPHKGQAFRCIHHRTPRAGDSAVTQAMSAAHIKAIDASDAASKIKEWTVWIDPKNVAVRLGEDGTVSSLTLTKGNSNQADQNLISTSIEALTPPSSSTSSPIISSSVPSMPSTTTTSTMPIMSTMVDSAYGSYGYGQGYNQRSFSPRRTNKALTIIDPVTLQVA